MTWVLDLEIFHESYWQQGPGRRETSPKVGPGEYHSNICRQKQVWRVKSHRNCTNIYITITLEENTQKDIYSITHVLFSWLRVGFTYVRQWQFLLSAGWEYETHNFTFLLGSVVTFSVQVKAFIKYLRCYNTIWLFFLSESGLIIHVSKASYESQNYSYFWGPHMRVIIMPVSCA